MQTFNCAGKGFGDESSASREDRAKRRNTKKEVRQVLKSLHKRKTRPIDPEEAAKGKLDVATIKDWDSNKMENLEVESFAPNQTIDPSAPLYVRLARTLEFLETSGELDCKVSGLQPFESWNFLPINYAQVMNNLTTAHGAFEETVNELIFSLEFRPSLGDFDTNALSLFSSDKGWDRRHLLKRDFDNFLSTTPGVDEKKAAPTKRILQYVKLVRKFGKTALSEEPAENRIAAVCKLMVHGYLLRLTHITSGSRVVSVGVEKLDLIAKDAVSAARDYPDEIHDPVRSFVEDINALGGFLTEDHIQMMLDELPVAFVNAALVYEPLARIPQSVNE